MRILLTGATGFIGKHLAARLIEQKHEIVAPVRDPSRASKTLGTSIEFHAWSDIKAPLPKEAARNIDAVIHLAGEPIAEGRWTKEKKQKILESREIGTRNVVAAVRDNSSQLKTFISSSAVGYYGFHQNEWLTETSKPGQDFLSNVTQKWESEATKLESSTKARVVLVRTGMVLGADGGALPKMLPVFRLGAGGKLGDGLQWMSWIHVEDLVRIFLFALENESVKGPINAVAPNPVQNAEFTKNLAAALGKSTFLPVPSFALKLALGELSDVLLLGQRVSSEKIQKLGFEFYHPNLSAALKGIVSEK